MRSFAYVALCGAAMGSLFPHVASAQQAPATAAGDISASEATPLPPLDVTAPSEPLSKPKVVKSKKGGATSASSAAPEAGEGGASGEGKPGIFTLGQLSMIGGATVSNETMWTFNTVTLPQAASLAPGVSMTLYGGSRNEGDVLVRGFDRWRVPLTVDGARIYLPADNRLDMNRFLTPDIAEIQIQKGYVSVLNGPGGMGGSINLVSRKPTKDLEAEARVGMTFDGDLSEKNAFTAYGRVGTRKETGYAQVSGTLYNLDHWNLSDDYTPAAGALQKGGDRDQSDTKDWRINAKIGYTPNQTDEYAISYTAQDGEKSAPIHIRQTSATAGRFWTWPTWDVRTLSGFTYTKVGESSYVKTNTYYNTLNNSLFAYDNFSYTSQSAKGFMSWYDDFAYGGMVEMGTNLIPMNTLKVSGHYRFDHHGEHDHNNPPGGDIEPMQYREEHNWYYAAENTFHATKWFDIVTGVSNDNARLKRAENYTLATGLTANPTGQVEAWNWQSAAILRYSNEGKVYASISDRTRFATLFERFSTRFGTAVPNPTLSPEKATNYEIGWSDTFNRKLKLSSAVFYSDITDSIQSVQVGTDVNGGAITQSQNVGDGVSKGIELSADYDLIPGLRVGGNYTLLKREISDPLRPTLKAEGSPEHEAFVYLAWEAMRNLTITPSLELASDRWSVLNYNNAPANTFIETGAYALVNLNVEYRINEHVVTSLAGRNLTDKYYELSEGFPDPGRQFYANIRAEF